MTHTKWQQMSCMDMRMKHEMKREKRIVKCMMMWKDGDLDTGEWGSWKPLSF